MHAAYSTTNEINAVYKPWFFNRRESPWKVDVESSGVPAKLRLLEQELINLEKVVNGDISKIPLVMRKQVKRYQTLTGKIDDLCKRMVCLLLNSIRLPSFVEYKVSHISNNFHRCYKRSYETQLLFVLILGPYMIGIIGEYILE